MWENEVQASTPKYAGADSPPPARDKRAAPESLGVRILVSPAEDGHAPCVDGGGQGGQGPGRELTEKPSALRLRSAYPSTERPYPGAAATVTAGTKTHSCGLPMSCPAFTGCTSDVVTGGFNCDATVAGANGCVITKVATPITTRTASSCPTAICALKFNDLSIPYCELHCQAECEETTVIHNLSTACRTVWPAGGGQ